MLEKAKLEEALRWVPGRVVLAVEAGSRAHGFESADSDYDVRFLFVQQQEKYLDLWGHQEVFTAIGRDKEGKAEIDIVGWDLAKALRLAQKSNPSILEWLHSPYIYHKEDWFYQRLRDIMVDYCPFRLAMHYASLGQNQVKAYLRGAPPYNLKKTLYALRAFMCLKYLYNNKPGFPFVNFEELIAATLSQQQQEEARHLIKTKIDTEKAEGFYPSLDAFIVYWSEKCYDRVHEINKSPGPAKSALQELFFETVRRE